VYRDNGHLALDDEYKKKTKSRVGSMRIAASTTAENIKELCVVVAEAKNPLLYSGTQEAEEPPTSFPSSCSGFPPFGVCKGVCDCRPAQEIYKAIERNHQHKQ